ncbi:MAG: Piwi domain-containing protein [Chloroflexales bacterium]
MTEPSRLILNIVPISFSGENLRVGRLPYQDEESYRTLRENHRHTHTFRFDQRTGDLLNVSLVPDHDPLGALEEVPIQEHLLLVAKAVQDIFLKWIAGRRTITKGGKRLVFWGSNNQARLLSQACTQARVEPITGIEVYHRYDLDCRMFWDTEQQPYLGLVISVDTTNAIDLPVAELIARGVSMVGRCVCQRGAVEQDYILPKLDILGEVQRIKGNTLVIEGPDGTQEFDTSDVIIEPRLEHLEAIVKACYKGKAAAVLAYLRQKREELTSASGQLQAIRYTLGGLQQQQFVIAPDITIQFGDLLDEGDRRFPTRISTERPPLLFGPQGRNTSSIPDQGIRRYGPYLSMQHTRNEPLIAVVCEAQYRGRVEQFLNDLLGGFPDERWTETGKENPFVGGLVAKFRLARIRYEIEECPDSSPEAYRAAARRLLARLTQLPDLAIVQTREAFKQYVGDANAYFVAKATFMGAGVPIQAVTIEIIETPGTNLAYVLNTVSLATYAKLDGVPWVISTRSPASHEIVIGIGSSEVTTRRWAGRERYVGLTTMFQGDGRYLVWELTREVAYDDYPQALLESLQSTLRYVQQQNSWQPNDKVRLVCHVYKRLKDCEVEAIKALVRQLTADRYQVEFAFLDISLYHPYHLIDPAQPGFAYWSGGKKQIRGHGVPERGICLQLDRRRALLHLTGPKDLKTAGQGLPQPLLVELHSDSDFTDLTYLLRQIYHFTYMSWRSFFPATLPVTIHYSQIIARLLGNLRHVNGWDSTVLMLGSLRGRRWFL